MKGFVNIILIVATVILVGVLGYFALKQKLELQESTQQLPVTSTDQQPVPPSIGETNSQSTGTGSIGRRIVSLAVLSPNGGERLKTGEEHVIQWSFSADRAGLTTVTLELLTKTGSQVGFIADVELEALAGTNIATYSFKAKEVVTRNAKVIQVKPGDYFIRISDLLDPTHPSAITDISDKPFSIY